MTERLYLDDAYLRRFDATVTAVDGRSITLDRTAFYPTGGGQPHDTGTLVIDGATHDVVDVSGRETIHHELEHTVSHLAVGERLEGEIDWERRHALMRYHTAQHLLSAVLLDRFGAMTTGNQLYDTRARIDCAYPRFSDTEMDEINTLVSSLIEADYPVRTYTLDRETAEATLDTSRTRIDLIPASVRAVRIVEIGPEGDPIDQTACAGTHVDSTGELGTFELSGRETKGSDEERLTFELR